MAKFEDRCFVLKYHLTDGFLKKCKDVIWVGWKRINEDGQMGGEPIKKKLCSTILYIRLDFESHIEIQ